MMMDSEGNNGSGWLVGWFRGLHAKKDIKNKKKY